MTEVSLVCMGMMLGNLLGFGLMSLSGYVIIPKWQLRLLNMQISKLEVAQEFLWRCGNKIIELTPKPATEES